MEMSQIRYALAVAKNLNFTRAAAECHVSQPALTKAVRNLESDLGGQLFHREGKRVLVSDFGRTVLPHLRQIIDTARTTQLLAADFRLLHKTPVRLGVLSTVGHVRFSRFLAQFQSAHAGVEVAVETGSLPESAGAAEPKENSTLLSSTPLRRIRDALNIVPLYQERYVVVFPPGHHLANTNGVRLEDLSGEPYVDRLSCEMREMVTAVCRDRSVELYARFRSEREDWVQAMVAAEIGFAFMPECSVTLPDLLQRPLVDPEVTRTIALVSVPGRQHNPATAALVRSALHFKWPG